MRVILRKRHHGQAPIGMPRVATTVAALQGLVESRDPARDEPRIGFCQIIQHHIPLGIHIAINVMGHLPGGPAQFDAGVMGRRAQLVEGGIKALVLPRECSGRWTSRRRTKNLS